MRSYIVIPARWASTRLPNKMLLRQTGRSLLEHTYQAALGARKPCGVIVATDHAAILAEVRRFGGRAILTSESCASGTDRVAEVARDLADAQIIVNVQGDEPEIDPRAIDHLIELLQQHTDASMATLATPIYREAQFIDPACVKVVMDDGGRALYFSRSPIPYRTDAASEPGQRVLGHQHIGMYAYRRAFLLRVAAMPPSTLEQSERLEQLRVLQMGEPIMVRVIEHAAHGIDTPDDYAAFVTRQTRRAG